MFSVVILDPSGAERNCVPQSTIQRALTSSKIDLAPPYRPPSAVRVLLAAMLSIGGSLLIDALLVSAGTDRVLFDEGLRALPVL